MGVVPDCFISLFYAPLNVAFSECQLMSKYIVYLMDNSFSAGNIHALSTPLNIMGYPFYWHAFLPISRMWS